MMPAVIGEKAKSSSPGFKEYLQTLIRKKIKKMPSTTALVVSMYQYEATHEKYSSEGVGLPQHLKLCGHPSGIAS